MKPLHSVFSGVKIKGNVLPTLRTGKGWELVTTEFLGFFPMGISLFKTFPATVNISLTLGQEGVPTSLANYFFEALHITNYYGTFPEVNRVAMT
jgi:hypothetical protein